MKVILDYRERRVLKYFVKFCDYLEITNLPIGDILFEYGLIVERKSADDFVSSIRNRRLWEQLKILRECEEIMGIPIQRKLLLIHGSFASYPAPIAGAIYEIIFNYQIPVVKLENYELEDYLRILYKREKEGKNSLQPEESFKLFKARKTVKRELSEEEWKIYILSSMPEVGEVLAKRLIERFGSIHNIANATVGQLMQVEGIGEKKAKKIYRMFH